jgi:hypothetical protein
MFKSSSTELLSFIEESKDQPFLKGYYFINVFHENTKLGGTSIKLK